MRPRGTRARWSDAVGVGAAAAAAAPPPSDSPAKAPEGVTAADHVHGHGGVLPALITAANLSYAALNFGSGLESSS